MQNPGAQHAQEAQHQQQAEVQVPDVAPGHQDPLRREREQQQHRGVQNVAVPNVQVVQVQVQMPNQLEEPPGPPEEEQGMQEIPQEQPQDERGRGSPDGEGHHPQSDERQAEEHIEDSQMEEPVDGSSPTCSHATAAESSQSENSPTTNSEQPLKDSERNDGACGSQPTSIGDNDARTSMVKPHSPESSSATSSSAQRSSSKTLGSEDVTQRRNVRDASTSATASRFSCPIHGSVMQDICDDDQSNSTNSNSSNEDHSRVSRSPPEIGTDSVSSSESMVQSIGVQAKENPAPNQEPRPQMCDQATSTSDPVMEADPVLIFKCNSQTLKSATFNDCGISHIHLQGCQNLQSVQGMFSHITACKVANIYNLNAFFSIL